MATSPWSSQTLQRRALSVLPTRQLSARCPPWPAADPSVCQDDVVVVYRAYLVAIVGHDAQCERHRLRCGGVPNALKKHGQTAVIPVARVCLRAQPPLRAEPIKRSAKAAEHRHAYELQKRQRRHFRERCASAGSVEKPICLCTCVRNAHQL
jgi:hypothetical protein